MNELRAANGRAPLIHSNEPYGTMLAYTEQRAARPYEYDPVKQFEVGGTAESEVDDFLDAVPDGGRNQKLLVLRVEVGGPFDSRSW